MSNSVLSASAKGATFLILLQIGSRALTFGVNQFILRYLSPEVLGGAVQLELYSITVLYFARESLRVALQRQQDGVQAAINLAYLASLLGAPLAFILAFLYLRSDLPNIAYFPDAIKTYAVATVIELLAEPGFAAASQRMLYRVRASAEGFAALARTAATCGSVILAHRAGTDVGVMPFANGQFAFSMGLLASYLYLLQSEGFKEGFSLLPRKMKDRCVEDLVDILTHMYYESHAKILFYRRETQYIFSYFSRPLCNLTFSLMLQSGLKYLLTQGDSILLTTFASLSDQGAYALASNYGGLIARMVFQPIEESSRTLFAKLCASPPNADSTNSESDKADTASSPKSRSEVSARTNPNLDQARSTMNLIIHFYILISLPLITLAPGLIPPLFPLLFGARWSATSAPRVLAAYVYYIPFLAINGIVEAFVAAVANAADLAAQSVAMGGAFAGFGATAWWLLTQRQEGKEKGAGDGGVALVVANCVNLGGRIAWGLYFVRGWFRAKRVRWEWSSALPSRASVVISAGVLVVLRVSDGVGGAYGIWGEVGRIDISGLFHGGLL